MRACFLEAEFIREREVVGGASIHVSDEFRALHPDWPWKQMRDTRNQLIHGYAMVDLRVAWDTVREDLPGLLERLDQVLSQAADYVDETPSRQRKQEGPETGR